MGMFICKSRILIEYLGKFLLVERHFKNDQVMFVLPGGKVEPFDETESEIIKQLNGKEHNDQDVLLNTLRRELYEELQLNITGYIDYFSSSFYINLNDEPCVDAVFYTKLTERPEIVVDGKEVTSFVWMDQKEILASDRVHDWLKKALRVFDRID